MTIAEVRDKSKALAAKIPRDYLILGVLVLASSLSFMLGYLSGREAGQRDAFSVTVSPGAEIGAEGQVVASKNGTRYYLPNCPAAGRLSETNKIWFASPAAAEAAGYAAATNCP